MNLMSEKAFKWSETADTFTPMKAKAMVDRQKQAYFFKHAPPVVTDGKIIEILRNKAKLLLWITWAWQRDRNYWVKVNQEEDAVHTSGKTEVWAWEVVRLELLRIGVPSWATTTYTANGGQNHGLPRLNFPAFIDWCVSESSLLQLISDVPVQHDFESVNELRHQWRMNMVSHGLRG
jgi:hypothetical protein